MWYRNTVRFDFGERQEDFGNAAKPVPKAKDEQACRNIGESRRDERT